MARGSGFGAARSGTGLAGSGACSASPRAQRSIRSAVPSGEALSTTTITSPPAPGAVSKLSKHRRMTSEAL